MLGKKEKNLKRMIKMLERRKELLTPIFEQINPKAFVDLWQKLLVEIAEINYSIFETLFEDNIMKMNYDKNDNEEIRREKLRRKKHKR